MKARLFGAPAIFAALVVIVAVSVGGVASAASRRHMAARQASEGTAPGGPGSESYFDLARKDCVGTARNTTSKVWFTVADGVLQPARSHLLRHYRVKATSAHRLLVSLTL